MLLYGITSYEATGICSDWAAERLRATEASHTNCINKMGREPNWATHSETQEQKMSPTSGLPTHWSGQWAKVMSSVPGLNYGSEAKLVTEHLPLPVSRKTRAEFSGVVSISRLTELKACCQVVMMCLT